MKQWWFIIVLAVVLIGLAVYDIVRPFSSGTASPQASSTPSEIISGIQNVTYTNSQLGFTVQYPATAIPSASDISAFLALTQTPVTSFVLPDSMYEGTNLAEAGVYVGATTSPAIVSACTQPSANLNEKSLGTVTINSTDFAVFTSADAGAGNFYESRSYRRVNNGTCLEFNELLHSGNIANYTPGQVVEFDHAKFSGILDAIVRTYQNL